MGLLRHRPKSAGRCTQFVFSAKDSRGKIDFSEIENSLANPSTVDGLQTITPKI
jgi:hypothetical protein